MLEETGYKVAMKSIISKRNHPEFPVHITYFECKIIESGTINKINPEIKSIKWIDSKNIFKYFTSDLDPEVKRHLKMKRGE